MISSQGKQSSDLFLRSDVGTGKAPVTDTFEEVDLSGKPSPFASLEALERFIFSQNCPSFSLIAIETKIHTNGPEIMAAHLEKLENDDKILIVREKKNRFLILLEEKDTLFAEDFIRAMIGECDNISFSAGIFYHPLDGFSAGSSLWNAKKALKHSKLSGADTIIPFDAVSLNISGDDAWQEGNIDEAIREYEAALKLDPEHTNVLNSLGVCFAAKNELDRALELFDKSAVTDSNEAMPVYNAGLVHEIKEEREKALEAFEKAMLLAPDSFEIFFHAGKVHMDSNSFEKALPLLEKAHELRPEHGPALALSAECFLMLEDFEKAFKFFRKAQQRMPQNPHVLSGLGFCFFKKNEGLDIATTFCEEALAIEPDNALFALRLARIWQSEGKEEKAFPMFLRAKNAGLALSENEQIFVHRLEVRSA